MSDSAELSLPEGAPDFSERAIDHGRPLENAISAGRLLRRAREAAGLHIAALAVSLKVPVKKLEALEADRFDLLPDTVFTRALASSVCRSLKIDPSQVLGQLPRTSIHTLTYEGVGINVPFRAPGDGPGPSVWVQMSRPAVLAGLALLLGALVLILLPAVKFAGDGSKSQTASSNAVAGIPGTSVTASTAVASDAVQLKTASIEQAGSSIGAVVATGAEPALPGVSLPLSPLATETVLSDKPAASATPAVAAVAGAAILATSSASTSGVVVFTAKGSSWIEVTDSKGAVVLRRMLNAGETASASGVLPLRAVVGRADSTSVQIRGKAFDLSAYAKDNVARFEVR
jgi:cytoskeleton protein RodZ